VPSSDGPAAPIYGPPQVWWFKPRFNAKLFGVSSPFSRLAPWSRVERNPADPRDPNFRAWWSAWGVPVSSLDSFSMEERPVPYAKGHVIPASAYPRDQVLLTGLYTHVGDRVRTWFEPVGLYPVCPYRDIPRPDPPMCSAKWKVSEESQWHNHATKRVLQCLAGEGCTHPSAVQGFVESEAYLPPRHVPNWERGDDMFVCGWEAGSAPATVIVGPTVPAKHVDDARGVRSWLTVSYAGCPHGLRAALRQRVLHERPDPSVTAEGAWMSVLVSVEAWRRKAASMERLSIPFWPAPPIPFVIYISTQRVWVQRALMTNFERVTDLIALSSSVGQAPIRVESRHGALLVPAETAAPAMSMTKPSERMTAGSRRSNPARILSRFQRGAAPLLDKGSFVTAEQARVVMDFLSPRPPPPGEAGTLQTLLAMEAIDVALQHAYDQTHHRVTLMNAMVKRENTTVQPFALGKSKPRAVLAAAYPTDQAVFGSVVLVVEAFMRNFGTYDFLGPVMSQARDDDDVRSVIPLTVWDPHFPFLFAPFSDAQVVAAFVEFWKERGFTHCLCADGSSWDLYQSSVVHEGFTALCSMLCGGLPTGVIQAFERVCTHTVADTRLGAQVIVEPLLASGLRFTTCLNTWSWSRVVSAFLDMRARDIRGFQPGRVIAIIGGDDMTLLLHHELDVVEFKRSFVDYATSVSCPMTGDLVPVSKFTFYSSQTFPGLAADGTVQYRLTTCIGRALARMFSISDLSQRPTDEWVLAVLEQKLEAYQRAANHVPILGPFVTKALDKLRSHMGHSDDVNYARRTANAYYATQWRNVVPMGQPLNLFAAGEGNAYAAVAEWYSTPQRPVDEAWVRAAEAEILASLDRPEAVVYPDVVGELLAIEAENGAADSSGLAELGWRLP